MILQPGIVCATQLLLFSPKLMFHCFATPWTITCQAPLSMGFSRQEYLCGFPFLSQRDLPDPGIEPGCPALVALAGGFLTTELPGKTLYARLANVKTYYQKYSFQPFSTLCLYLKYLTFLSNIFSTLKNCYVRYVHIENSLL